MQDRFKFRVWNGAEMHYNDFVVTATGYVGKITEEFLGNCVINQEDLTADKECVLMQCTGLKDKNSKLIYEGDRVYIDCEDETAIIKWSDDLARFTIHFEDEAVFADFDNYYSKELEVIGNIYENSELPKE